MPPLEWFLFVTGAIPLWLAWRANRSTSLSHAVLWAVAAWVAWGWALASSSPPDGVHYLALCLTACAGVAVLGARRPGVAAWDAVVAGLLAVLVLPWLEGLFLGGELQLGGIRGFFLAMTLAVGVVNYLPTRLGLAALSLAFACSAELGALLFPHGQLVESLLPAARWCLAAVPWLAYLSVRGAAPVNDLDRHWLGFRDRFGMVWGLRVREQFNRAAHHAGWPVALGWSGLRPLEGTSVEPELVGPTLSVLLQRFGLNFRLEDAQRAPPMPIDGPPKREPEGGEPGG